MIFPDTKEELPFVIHEHQIGNKIDYQLSVKTADNELQFLTFPRAGNMDTISDTPNVTRLFGTLSKDTRSKDWLTFNGKTLEPEGEDLPGIYSIMTKGALKVGEQTEKHSEVFLSSPTLTDRWIIRKIPNVLDKSLFSDKEIYLFWKPPRQKTYSDAF